MKQILIVSAVLAGFFLLASPVSADSQIPDYTEQFYVNDFANVLSDETEKHIFETSKKLDEETGAQIVVATVADLGGRDIEGYATDMFRHWRIGDNEKNSGLLLLVSVEDRRLRIEVGYGLEGILPDGKVGRVRDEQIVPQLKENKWDEGVIDGYNALFAVVDENREEIGKAPPDRPVGIDYTWIIVLTVFGVIGLLIFLSFKHPEWGSSGGGSNSSRGGRSSGSSSSESSSGGGHSGGGGSSGGGGASGSF